MDPRTILITGGSRGLGRAMAEALAQQGHRIAVTGRDDVKLQEVVKALPGTIALNADVADPVRTQAVVDEVAKDFGPIDVLINNAGIGGDENGPQSLVDMNVDSWWRVQETNVKGPMLCSRAVLPGMIDRGSGIIINVGSYIAIRPSAMTTAYATSKAALARFSDSLALEVADQGVQVFCVSPGLVLTDMTRDLPFIKNVPDSEFHQPEEIAALACELVTGNFGELSGRFIHVRDDLQALVANSDRMQQEQLYQLSLHGLSGLIG